MSYRNSPHPLTLANVPSLAATLAWLVGAALVQATVGHALAIRGAVPSLVLIVVVFAAVRLGTKRALLIGIFGGLLEDALTAGTIGAWTIATGLTALAIGSLARVLFSDAPPAFICAVVFGSLLRSALFWAWMSLNGYPPGLAGTHAHLALTEALYTGALATGVAIWLERKRERPIQRFPVRDFR